MDQSSKKFKVVTLGCRTNQYESQAYTDQLKQLGYELAADHEEADVCIVNTCTVTQSADNQSLHEIRHLAAKNPGSKLVVTGCAAEQEPERIKAIEGVTAVISNKNKESLVEALFPNWKSPNSPLPILNATREPSSKFKMVAIPIAPIASSLMSEADRVPAQLMKLSPR